MAQSPDYSVKIVDLLRGPLYDRAREAIIAYETLELERAESAWLELRDVLEHLRLAARATDENEVDRELGIAQEHLRRAAAEPAQDMVEARVERIERRSLRWHSVKRFLYSLPTRQTIETDLREIQHHWRIGREEKSRPASFESALDHFTEAHRLALNLHFRLQPSGRRAWVTVAIALFTLIGLVATVTGAIVGITSIITMLSNSTVSQ